MTSRNLEKELQYYIYNDPEYGEDVENISYPALIELLGELLQRIEKLEKQNTDLISQLKKKPSFYNKEEWNETGSGV
jgi:hypothetical protein